MYLCIHVYMYIGIYVFMFAYQFTFLHAMYAQRYTLSIYILCIHIVYVRTRYAYVYIHLCIIGCVYNIYSHICTIIIYIIYCKCTRLETHVYWIFRSIPGFYRNVFLGSNVSLVLGADPTETLQLIFAAAPKTFSVSCRKQNNETTQTCQWGDYSCIRP